MTIRQKQLADRYAKALQMLEAIGQEHVLTYYDRLDEVSRHQLLTQIEGIDWPEVARLRKSHVLGKPQFKLPDRIEPALCYPYKPEGDMVARYDLAQKMGEKLIREGKVAAFTVAGGQGTRLGWDAPKGTFPATPIREKPLFQIFAEYLLKVQQKFGCTVPWYIMTSPANDKATRQFFEQHQYLGLDRKNVIMFPQAMMPAFDIRTGQVLLADQDSLALSPNGHGGSLKALYTSGALADMKDRGVAQISYFQVDNPNVKCIDPLFIGLHAMDHAQMSSKMLPKAYAGEKLGVFCRVDGKMSVIEYSDLPDELSEQRLPTGELRFRAGSIAIHMISVDFVASLNGSDAGFGLPFHRAEKKMPAINLDTGVVQEPKESNAIKLETFVFDALPLCDQSIVYETERVEEFAPIKNADAFDEKGRLISVDCPTSSKRLQTERAARWLALHGVAIPLNNDGWVDAVIELSHLTAIKPDDLASLDLPGAIEPGQELVL